MSIEDALDQPDAVDGSEEETGTEGLIGTEQPGSSPEDDAAAAEFFAGLGIDVPETMREQMGPVEEAPPEPEVEEEVDQVVGQVKPRAGILLANMGLGDEYPDLPLPPTPRSTCSTEDCLRRRSPGECSSRRRGSRAAWYCLTCCGGREAGGMWR